MADKAASVIIYIYTAISAHRSLVSEKERFFNHFMTDGFGL